MANMLALPRTTLYTPSRINTQRRSQRQHKIPAYLVPSPDTSVQSETRPYILNVKKALNKKLQQCHSDTKIHHELKAGNNHCYTFSAGIFEIFKETSLAFFQDKIKDSLYPHHVNIQPCKDKDGAVIELKIKISNKTSKGPGALRYMLNIYLTTCSMLLNGKYAQLYFSDHDTIVNTVMAHPEINSIDQNLARLIHTHLECMKSSAEATQPVRRKKATLQISTSSAPSTSAPTLTSGNTSPDGDPITKAVEGCLPLDPPSTPSSGCRQTSSVHITPSCNQASYTLTPKTRPITPIGALAAVDSRDDMDSASTGLVSGPIISVGARVSGDSEGSAMVCASTNPVAMTTPNSNFIAVSPDHQCEPLLQGAHGQSQSHIPPPPSPSPSTHVDHTSTGVHVGGVASPSAVTQSTGNTLAGTRPTTLKPPQAEKRNVKKGKKDFILSDQEKQLAACKAQVASLEDQNINLQQTVRSLQLQLGPQTGPVHSQQQNEHPHTNHQSLSEHHCCCVAQAGPTCTMEIELLKVKLQMLELKMEQRFYQTSSQTTPPTPVAVQLIKHIHPPPLQD